MKEIIEKLSANFDSFQKDSIAQLEKGNKAAGTRARKVALEIIKDLKEFRKASVEAAK